MLSGRKVGDASPRPPPIVARVYNIAFLRFNTWFLSSLNIRFHAIRLQYRPRRIFLLSNAICSSSAKHSAFTYSKLNELYEARPPYCLTYE